MNLPLQQVRRIERLTLEGCGPRRIAREMRLTPALVARVIGQSPTLSTVRVEQAERRRRREEARRRLLRRDMARAAHLPFLPEHRDARGRIDWDSVRGFSDFQAIAREAAAEAMR